MTTATLLPTTTSPLTLLPGGLSAAAVEAMSLDPATIVKNWIGSLKSSALRVYSRAIRDFSAWSMPDAVPSPDGVLRLLVGAGLAGATGLLIAFRDAQLAKGLSTATVAGAVSGLCCLIGAARRAGLVEWKVEKIAPKIERREDRSGPAVRDIERMIRMVDELADAGDALAARDAAVLRLLFCCGFRRTEVVGLHVDHLHLDRDGGPVVMVKRKGYVEVQPWKISTGTATALRRWLAIRGDGAGGVFARLDYAKSRSCVNLSGESVRRLCATRARQAGVRCAVRPHGCRHTGATMIARTGNLMQLRAYGGWRSLSSIQNYLDDAQNDRTTALAILDL